MKTAMQELIDYFRELRDFQNDDTVINRARKGAYVAAIIKGKELLEKEKQQIIDAYNEGYRDAETNDTGNYKGDVSEFSNASGYYDNTFKQ